MGYLTAYEHGSPEITANSFKRFGNRKIDGRIIEMTNINKNDFTIQFNDGSDWNRITIDFPETVEDSLSARKMFISMLEKAS